MNKQIFCDDEPIKSQSDAPKENLSGATGKPWKIIIADDQEEVHQVTKMALRRFVYEGQKIDFLSAYSGEGAKALIDEHPDVAGILLDVVMETDTAGFDVVRYIRDHRQNQIMQIILRTGQTGKVPEHKVMVDYTINDFKTKTELTATKLVTSMTAMLRNYQLVHTIQKLNHDLTDELSERRLVEKALKESEIRYRVLAETAREVIVSFDFNGTITYMNKYGIELSKHDPAEVLGKNISRFLITRSIMSDNDDYFYEADFLNKNGEKTPVEVSSSLLLKDDAPTGMLAIARNVSARNKALDQARLRQEQLFQADKMASLGTLVSGVAHEVNNPITAVMLNAPVLEKIWDAVIPVLDQHRRQNQDFSISGMDYSQVRDRVPLLLSDITNSAQRVKSIVNDLKDFARQTPSDIEFEEIDCNDAVEKAIGLVSNLIKKSTKAFSVQLQENLPSLMGHVQRIEQVMINLLVNACQALPDNEKSIQVTTRHDIKKNAVVIQVKDQGYGMPPELLERIKDPFFTTKRNSGGTGLGLSISDQIIQDHDGSLEFDSTPGEGTVAEIRLPAHQAPQQKKDKTQYE
jgi:PAS domain S-box-containing protein